MLRTLLVIAVLGGLGTWAYSSYMSAIDENHFAYESEKYHKEAEKRLANKTFWIAYHKEGCLREDQKGAYRQRFYTLDRQPDIWSDSYYKIQGELTGLLYREHLTPLETRTELTWDERHKLARASYDSEHADIVKINDLVDRIERTVINAEDVPLAERKERYAALKAELDPILPKW